MRKYNFLLIFVFLSTLYVSCYNNKDVNIKIYDDKPNVFIILTDDQGWGDLSYTGNSNLHTPNIDSLARAGAYFSNFYVSPVCSPTRAELLSGRYHPRSRVYHTSAGGERMDVDETTIAEVFKQAGYKTGIFGKWHNGMQYPYHPNGRGFDEFYGFASGHWGDYFSPRLLERNGKLVEGEGYIVDDFTDKALSFMETHHQDPFFLFVSYNTPHSPMQVPDRWWEKFANKELAMRHRDPEKEDLTFTRAALAMVENIDWNVGRLMDKLDKLALDKQTIVLFASDNGPNSWRWNGEMRGRKGSTDEGGVRSPLFITWTDVIESGTTITEISAAIDLLPTLADLAGIPAETAYPLDGVSLKPLLVDQNRDQEQEYSRNDRLIFSHWRGRTSVRNSTYRLDHEGRLYNIAQDRQQRHDISAEHPELRQTLSDSVAAWEKEVFPEDYKEPRPFPVGHPDFKYTQLPARDGVAHGGIERSNRFPNASFFRNWTSVQDSITWDVEVLSEGSYEVTLYYTCAPEGTGSTIALSLGSEQIETTLSEAHNPPLRGMEDDRVERMESYVKDFKPITMGQMHLQPGRQRLTLKAEEIPGNEVIDVRLLMIERIE